MARLEKALNIEDLRKIARRKLPKPLFNYIQNRMSLLFSFVNELNLWKSHLVSNS